MLYARVACGILAILAVRVVVAQSASSVLSGVITDHAGEPLAEIPIRAVNEATETDARTFSTASGSYELRGLPAGNYVVSIAPPCCALVPYSNDGVTLEPDQTLRLDITLEEGGSLNTLGDDPGTIASELRDRQVIPDLPVPRTADDHPDLSGVWLARFGPFPDPAKARPWAEEIAQERIADNSRDHPHTRCLPAALPFGGAARHSSASTYKLRSC